MSGRFLIDDTPQLDHAIVLMSQGRFDLAAARLREAIAADPEDGERFALLATCLLNTKAIKEAEAAARRAVELSADNAHNVATLAIALTRRNKGGEAIRTAQKAVEAAPSSSYPWFALAAAHTVNNGWAASLEAAEKGLEVDPDDANLRLLRNNALTKLGRPVAADEARRTLAQDPINDAAHTNLGWALLAEGKHTEAAGHFREALRIDPEYEHAREGLIEAIKARSLVYRPILAFQSWQRRLTVWKQLAAVGGVILFLYLFRKAGGFVPVLVPYEHVIRALAFASCLFVGFGNALVSLLLRFDPLGKHALDLRRSRLALMAGVIVLPLSAAMIGKVFSTEPVCSVSMVVLGGFAAAIVILMDLSQPAPIKVSTPFLVVLGALGVLLAVEVLVLGHPLARARLFDPFQYTMLLGSLGIWAWDTFGTAEE